MITGFSSKLFRPQTVIGIRQNVAVRAVPEVSQRLIRLAAVIIFTGIVVVFSAGRFMHGRIESAAGRIEQLQAVRSRVGNENIRLLAARAQLASEKNVVKEAAQRFQLMVPVKGQIRYL